MNKKIIIVVATVILCTGIAICGFGLAKNNNANNDGSYNQPVTNESVNNETTTNFTQSPNIVFETSIHTEKIADNNGDINEGTSADNRIYADDEDGVFNGGYFQWQ